MFYWCVNCYSMWSYKLQAACALQQRGSKQEVKYTLFNCIDFSLLLAWYWFLSFWFLIWKRSRVHNLTKCVLWNHIRSKRPLNGFNFVWSWISTSRVFTLTTNSFLLTEHSFFFKLQVCFARFQMEDEGPDLQNYKISKRWAKLADSKYSTVKAN